MALTAEQQALDYNPELQDVGRQRKLAELLMAQGMQQPQGQMISGRYIAPSFAQQLNPIANILAGQAIGERADTKQTELATALRGRQQQEITQFGELLKTDPNKAYQFAAQSQVPQLREAGLKQMMPREFDLAEGARRFTTMPDGTTKEIAKGGIKVDPDTRRAMQFLSLNKPIDQLTPQELEAVERKAIEFRKASASNVSLNIPTEGERKAGFMANILDKNILQMQNALKVDPSSVKPNVPASVVAAITGPNLLSRSITPAQRQIIEDSQLDVLDAALTLRTGAAYTKEQLNAMRETYFPILTDKPPAIAAKKQRLETLLEGAYIASGRATPPRASDVYTPPLPKSLSEVTGGPNMRPQGAAQAPRFLGFETPGK
jgi:hypothetical protein